MGSEQATGVMKARYGIDMSIDEVRTQLKAIKIIIAADGISAKEKVAFEARAREIGIPDELLKEVVEYKVDGVKLEDALKGFEKGSTKAKGLLLAAIRIAGVDGYSEKEQAAVAKAAKILGIDAKILPTLVHMADLEQALIQLRHSILA